MEEVPVQQEFPSRGELLRRRPEGSPLQPEEFLHVGRVRVEVTVVVPDTASLGLFFKDLLAGTLLDKGCTFVDRCASEEWMDQGLPVDVLFLLPGGEPRLGFPGREASSGVLAAPLEVALCCS